MQLYLTVMVGFFLIMVSLMGLSFPTCFCKVCTFQNLTAVDIGTLCDSLMQFRVTSQMELRCIDVTLQADAACNRLELTLIMALTIEHIETRPNLRRNALSILHQY